ncbi:MAG: lytic transglycosylase domain-containing protein [Desulfobulbaceae bacterium]|nr:lytic transglycosylase domain-containing protein [Desulfobulbaceae bacterium]
MSKSGATAKGGRGKKNGGNKTRPHSTRRFSVTALIVECVALLIIGLVTTVATLGFAAKRFSGLSPTANLLPFAAAVLALVVGCALFLTLWFLARRWLLRLHPSLAAALTLILAVTCGYTAAHPKFFSMYEQFRTMVGGREEVARRQLAHQIYASYRRIAPHDATAMLTREKLHDPAIREAAATFHLDADLLAGLAAVESSFLPRPSADGGDGLFQITSIPQAIRDEAKRRSRQTARQPFEDQRENAFFGAATLAHYIHLMDGDVFLGLLAYNIGPKNGGLLSIMRQYGARDFVSIQPYLQRLPADYPIRVFAWSLLFRVAGASDGHLPYQDGANAARIQTLGIPGLDGVAAPR